MSAVSTGTESHPTPEGAQHATPAPPPPMNVSQHATAPMTPCNNLTA